MSPAAEVLLWWLAFAGTHLVMSHPPVRRGLVSILGEPPFLGLYSLVAFATLIPLVWTYFADRETVAMPLHTLLSSSPLAWITAALMLFAFLFLVVGVLQPSPATVGRGQTPRAAGILRITRNPFFVGTALFGLAHLLINHSAIDRAFFGGFLVFSIVGGMHQDSRKRASGGEAMRSFYEETSFVPFAAIAAGRNRFVPAEVSPVSIALAVGVFAALFLFHDRLFG